MQIVECEIYRGTGITMFLIITGQHREDDVEYPECRGDGEVEIADKPIIDKLPKRVRDW